MEYRSPVCKARICRKSPLMFQHPSFILARRNNRHHFRVSSRVMPMPPGYTKVFGFAPTWCTKKSRNECCGFFVAPFPPGRTRTSRKRSCSSRGDWSLKMAAGLWAGATIKRERKRGANNVRRALRTTARAVLRSKMEALQADKRTGLNS